MDSRQKMKEIYLEIMSGGLEKAIQYLELSIHKQLDNSNKFQLNILITLSQITSKPNIIQKTELQDIEKLVYLCCTQISDPTETEMSNYYRSLYHIFMYLKDKLSLPKKTLLYNHIFPDWLPESNAISTEITELLAHFTNLISTNLISKETITSNATTKDTESLINLYKQHLKISLLTFEKNQNLLFQKIRWYINMFQKNIGIEYLKDFCEYVFNEILDKLNVPKLNSEGLTELYYSLSAIILVNFNPNENKSLNSSLDKKSFQIMQKISYKNSEMKLCAEIFRLFHQNFVTNHFFKSNLNELIELRELCESIFTKFGLSTIIFRTFTSISELIRFRVPFFDNLKKEYWVTVDNQILVEYIKIFDLISKVIKHDKYVHKCQDENCSLEQNYNHAFTILSLGSTFLNLSLRYECKNIEILNDIVAVTIKNCLKFVTIIKSKNCSRWITNWRIIGALIYNIGTKFYQFQNFRLARFYFKLIVTYLINFEGTKQNNCLITENCLSTTLNLIANTYSNIQRYREALTYLAFGLYLTPDFQKSWSNWVNVKFKANSNEVGNICELTTKDILETDLEILKQIYPELNPTTEELESLLLVELRSYATLWASKIPIKNASSQFFALCTDPHLATIAFCLSWEKVITLQDEFYTKYLEKTINILLRKKDIKSQICLSVLYYVDFQIKNYEIFKKNLMEMNEYVPGKVNLNLKPHEEQPNPNDRCEINPTYYNNKIDNILGLYKILFKVSDLWTKIFSNSDIHNLKDFLLELNVPDIVKKVAFEMRVHNYRYKMLKIWFLYLQLGTILNKNDLILMAIGFILENVDLKSGEMVKNLTEKAKNYLNDPKISVEIKTTFYVNKSMGLLRSNCLREGVESLELAKGLLLNSQDGPQKVLEARITYLESLYLQKSCISGIVPHNQNFILLAHNSFANIAEYYKNGGSKCLYTLSILFDISLMIGRMYKFLRMPREVRCYTSESVLLAQQIVLPLRTAQYFSLLAFTDLLGHRFDDCQVKISGLDYILGNQNNATLKKSCSENFEDKLVEINKGVQNLNLSNPNEIEVMLDVPIDHRIKNLQGSPILNTKSFTLPSFIYHLDCSCFYCTNFDFSRLILESTHLEATYFMQQNNVKGATEFFKGALRIYRGLLKKYESKNLSPELLSLFKKDLNLTYSEMLIDYSIFFAKINNQKHSLKILDEITEIMGPNLDNETYIHMEVLYNKMNFLSALQIQNEPAAEPILPTLNNSDLSVYLVKTPENKVSVIKFDNVSPINEPSNRRRLRKELKFDLSDTDVEQPKKETFKLKVEKTPAPNKSKIKIFTPSTSTANKIKPLDMQLSPKNELKELPIIKSPQNSTSRLQTKKLLDENTKILTQKLKNQIQKDSIKSTSSKGVRETKKVEVTEKKVVTRGRKKITTSEEESKSSKENVDGGSVTRRKGSSSESSRSRSELPKKGEVSDESKKIGTVEKTRRVLKPKSTESNSQSSTKRKPYKRIVAQSSSSND